MKEALLSVLMIFFIFTLNAQNLPENSFEKVFSRNHVTFTLQNGFTRGKAFSEYGNFRPDPRTGYVYRGTLNYTVNLSDQIGFSIGTGIGAFPVNFEMYQLDLGRSSYFDDVEYRFFASFNGELNYRIPLNKTYILNGFAGINSFYFNYHEHEIGYSSFNQPHGIYKFDIIHEKGWRQNYNFGGGISKLLNNRDLLTFRVDYHHSVRNIYNGQYVIMPFSADESGGKFSNHGHHLNLGIAYTFSRTERDAKLQTFLSEGAKKESKTLYKKEKRAIKEQTTYIGSTGGLTFPISRAIDNNNVIINATIPNLMPYFFMEHNLKKNFYAELGFGFQEYFDALRFKGSPIYGGTNIFHGYQISAGTGKRLIGKKSNYNYLNLTAGIVANFLDREKGLIGSSGGSIISITGTDTIYYYRSEDYILRKFNPLLYIGASKDFRISGNFHLTFLYRYHQGLLNLYEKRVDYVSMFTSGQQQARVILNGSFHTFQIGTKFNLGNLTEKQITKNRKPYEKGSLILSAMPGFIFYQSKTSYHFKHEDWERNGKFKERRSALLPVLGADYYLSNQFAIESRINFHNLHLFNMSIEMLQNSLGISRRISLPKGLYLLNIHAGINGNMVVGGSAPTKDEFYHDYYNNVDQHLFYNYDQSSMKGQNSSFTVSGNDTISYGTTTFGLTKRVFPQLYFGASKDFRISDKSTLSFSYFRNFGFAPFYVEQERWVSQNGYFDNSVTTLSGMSSTILFSFKYRLK
jgi:hypothetical protein